MKGKARATIEPFANLGMFVSGVVVEDHIDRLASRHRRLDGIEEGDKF